MAHYVGQRLSLKGQLCTVRYVGPVEKKPGQWLGVEWDDAARGKHNGTHEGVNYFEFASFLRPSQPWDESRTFYQALREKYMSEDAVKVGETVYFSSKQAEEVGFEKFAKRQAALQGIHVLILDHMRVRYTPGDEDELIRDACKEIMELDLGSNLFESLDDALSLVTLLPKLVHLVLDGNRFDVTSMSSTTSLPRISSLSLSNTMLRQNEAQLGSIISRHFPNVRSLKVAGDELRDTSSLGTEALPITLTSWDLSSNSFSTLADLQHLSACKSLVKLNLEKGQIECLGELRTSISNSVIDLDLAYNNIQSWELINALPAAFPAMKQLRMTGNPIYKDLTSATGKPLMAEDGYMLTIARLPQLEVLNYSKITEKERLNAEKYYLNEIVAELTAAVPEKRQEILKRHSRWNALCEEYGEPIIPDQPTPNTIDPRSLAAGLITLTFTFPFPFPFTPQSQSQSPPEIQPQPHPHPQPDWQIKLPKSFNIYSLLGVLGKKLGMMPLRLRLVWETGEFDLIGGADASGEGVGEWDSDDDDGGGGGNGDGEGEGKGKGEEREEEAGPKSNEVAREVELMGGTRTLGTYIEGREARIRVEVQV